MWINLYGQSTKDHGTLGFFCSLLNRKSITSDVKKSVDDILDFLECVVKGHLVAKACAIAGVDSSC